jgi:pimeloyl-ACP methyl ester carboxylesterase
MPPNNAMQTDKAKLSRLLLTQKPRQLGFAADRERWAIRQRGARDPMRILLLLAACLVLVACERTPVPLDAADVPSVLHYEQSGEGEPVVLIQGANLPMQMWDAQVQSLIPEFQVVRYDVRGFGGSGPSDAVPYQSHMDLRALLDHLGIERAHLVGLSLGGRIAVDFALAYPERVRSMVLAGPGLSGYTWDEAAMREWFAPIDDAIGEGDSLRAADLWLQTGFMAPAMEDAELAPWLTRLARANARVWCTEDWEVPLSRPAVDRLAEIRLPTMLLLGERDVADQHRIVEHLYREVRDAQRVVLPDVGHVVNLEAPDEFNRLVLEFLHENASG